MELCFMRATRTKRKLIGVLEEEIRKLCLESEARLTFADPQAVYACFRHLNPNGDLRSTLTDRIRLLLPDPTRESFDNGDLQHVARTFYMERAILAREHTLDVVMRNITTCLTSGIPLKPLDDPAWKSAIDIARGLYHAGFEHPPTPSDVGIGKELAKLHKSGYSVGVSEGQVWMTSDDLNRATADILRRFTVVGVIYSFDALFALMKQIGVFRDGQYLFPRISVLGERPPSIPFNFLINIAVKSSASARRTTNREFVKEITEAIELSRQVAALLDVEPYSQWDGMFLGTEQLEVFLQELAVFDHLFTLRQWPPSHAPFFLEAFFDKRFDSSLTAKFGWSIGNVVQLLIKCSVLCSTDPTIVTPSKLVDKSLNYSTVEKLLEYFSHKLGAVNKNYLSPADANQADFLFRPFVQVHTDAYIVPALSIAAYSTFEATLSAVRSLLSSKEISELAGDGTERIVRRLFERAQIMPSRLSSKYLVNGEDGECDLVLEDAEHIVFVECKAKALTRAAMAGVPGEALLDFAGAVMQPQAQALRHERILRTLGYIDFKDGYRLVLGTRKILRLSMTLMDLASLQDRSTFLNVFELLAKAEVKGEPGYGKNKELSYSSGQRHLSCEMKRCCDL
jgi:hypothetical protein